MGEMLVRRNFEHMHIHVFVCIYRWVDHEYFSSLVPQHPKGHTFLLHLNRISSGTFALLSLHIKVPPVCLIMVLSALESKGIMEAKKLLSHNVSPLKCLLFL